jgi:hypothetical protein
MYRRHIKLIKFVLNFLNLLTIFGCKGDGCFKGAGNDSVAHIETGYFKTVNFNGIFDVMLVQDTVCYVDFEGGENMLQYAKAENKDSVLNIDNSNECLYNKDYKKIKLSLHFTKIKLLAFYESCKIRTERPITDDFALIVPGLIADLDIELNNNHFFFYNHLTSAGIYTYRGKCTNCRIDGYYTSKIDASQLITKNMVIENHSIVDFKVRAEETLHVGLYDRGNVYYYGNPEVFIDTLVGPGKVFKAD